MSFANSFEKKAGVMSSLGGAAAKAGMGAKNIGAKAFSPIKNIKNEFVRGGRDVAKSSKGFAPSAELGSGVAAVKTRKAAEAMGGAAGPIPKQTGTPSKASRGTVETRQARMKDYQENKGKNWFQKNPIKSTVGAYIGARHLMGGNQEQPQQPPQIVQY